MESDTTVDGRPSPLSPPPVPSGVPAMDPLSDANCLKCGYALRGLTEYRCPECGTPFDPSDYVGTFVPKWPKLLLWMMVAVLGSAAFWCAAIIHGMGWRMGWSFGSGSSLPGPIWLAYDLYRIQKLVTLVLGCLVVKGLQSRSDWARWIAIILFLVVGVLAPVVGMVCVAWVIVGETTSMGSVGDWIQSIAVTVLGEVIPALLVIVYLATGFRRVSLARGSVTQPLVIRAARFSERSDWLLLIGVWLVMMAFGCAAQVADTVDDLAGADGAAECLAYTVAVIGFLVAARRSWRNPMTVRTSVCTAVVPFLIAWGLGVAGYVDMALNEPGYWWKRTAEDLLVHIGSLLPCIAVVLFVLKGIDRNDIERVARLPRKRHHAPV